MNKEVILKKIKKLDLNKNDYIISDNTSLVLQDILDSTESITLICSKEVYSSLDWNIKNNEIKYYDIFEISYNYFDNIEYENINDYQVQSISSCLRLKKLMNNKKEKKLIEKLDLLECLKDNYRYERELKNNGINLVAGVDEVGRGPLVGPVVAACVILPDNFYLDGLTDSKKLSEKKREEFYDKIMEQAISVGVGIVSEKIIDDINIYEATKIAMKDAINNCKIAPEHILIDAMPLDLDIPTTSIIKGDLKSITISAASVIAKVTRDRMLIDLDKKYPMYDFKSNKGYGTKKHLQAIEKYGIIDEHRRSFAPIESYIKEHSI